jgi:hypothetical protein
MASENQSCKTTAPSGIRYQLGILLSDQNFFLDITEEDFVKLRTARTNIMEALYIEEKFDIILGNYLDLELGLLSASAHRMIRPWQEYQETQIEKNMNASRRLFNLLASCRAYLDHVPHHLNRIMPFSGKCNKNYSHEFKLMTNKEYDTQLGYRAMEELRNYMQHRDFPIETCQNIRFVKTSCGPMATYSYDLRLSLVKIRESGKFKRKILNELGNEDTVTALHLIRSYVGALGRIHEQIRGTIFEQISTCEQHIINTINHFCEKSGQDDTFALAAFKYDEDVGRSETVYINRNDIDYWKNLAMKNMDFADLERRVVCGEDFGRPG